MAARNLDLEDILLPVLEFIVEAVKTVQRVRQGEETVEEGAVRLCITGGCTVLGATVGHQIRPGSGTQIGGTIGTEAGKYVVSRIQKRSRRQN